MSLNRQSKRISLREFANLNVEEMITFCDDRREIYVFDDYGNEVLNDTLLLSLTWFGLITHRHYNDMPYSLDEIITLNGELGYPRFIDDKLLLKPLLEFDRKILLETSDPVVYDFIRQLRYVHQNLLHNFLSIIGEPAVVSVRAMDVLPVYYHPKIQEVKQDRRNGKYDVATAMRKIEKILLTEPSFDKSILAMLYRTKGLDKIQTYQLLIERGATFDLNGAIAPFNIDASYAEGISKIHESLSDSKGGGFSLITNGFALQNAEWLHSKIHHLTSCLIGVRHNSDCGSQKGMVVRVPNKEFLHSLDGSYYFKDDGTLELIHRDTFDNIEIGSVIKVRSVAWCNYGGTGQPCAVCYGKMLSCVPYNPYTGHSPSPGLFFGSVFGERIGQAMLKTKHTIGDTSVAKYEVPTEGMPFINTDNKAIYFNEEYINPDKDPYLILDKQTHKEICAINSIETLDELDVSQIPTMSNIVVSVKQINPMSSRDGVQNVVIKTSVSSRHARMTKGLIDFLKLVPGEKEGKNTVRFSLATWDYEEPAYILPNINEDLDKYRKKTEDFLTYKHLSDMINIKVTEEFYGEQLLKYWDIVREQHDDINKITLDIILFCTMVRDPIGLDHGLPSADDDHYFVTFLEAFFHRGQGSPLIFGYQGKQINGTPGTFLYKNRQPGVLECYLKPVISRE